MSDNETELKLKRYLASGGAECPFCGSGSIEGGSVEVYNGVSRQIIECLKCNAEWVDQYTLCSVKSLSLDVNVTVGIGDNLHAKTPWGHHPDFPTEDWRYAVSNMDTVLGYWEWCTHREEEEAK